MTWQDWQCIVCQLRTVNCTSHFGYSYCSATVSVEKASALSQHTHVTNITTDQQHKQRNKPDLLLDNFRALLSPTYPLRPLPFQLLLGPRHSSCLLLCRPAHQLCCLSCLHPGSHCWHCCLRKTPSRCCCCTLLQHCCCCCCLQGKTSKANH